MGCTRASTGVTQFEFVDAFDGAGDNLDPDEVRKYDMLQALGGVLQNTALVHQPRLPYHIQKNASVQGMHQPIQAAMLISCTAYEVPFRMRLKLAGIEAVHVLLVDACRYINGVRFRVWKRGQPYQRRKVAIDLSHYQLLERILKENRTTLILEDDLELKTHNLYADLLKNMRLLPQVSGNLSL